MFRTNSFDRRTLLRGLGTTLGLPMLEAMATAKTTSPNRMAFVYVPNGIMMNEWIPDQAPGVTALPAQLPSVSAALNAFKNDILFLGGLTQNGGRALEIGRAHV